MPRKLNDALIRARDPPPGGRRLELHDTEIKGLVSRLAAAGHRTFCLRDGTDIRYNLGAWPGVSLAAA